MTHWNLMVPSRELNSMSKIGNMTDDDTRFIDSKLKQERSILTHETVIDSCIIDHNDSICSR